MQRVPANLVQAELLRAGVFHASASVRLGDAFYAPPALDWLLKEFDRWYRQMLLRLGIVPYVAEAGDCDDYADLYACLARVCHRRMPGVEGAALPVGILHYEAAGLGPHAINVALTSDRGLVFIEPQRVGTVLNLSAEERRSAWLLKL